MPSLKRYPWNFIWFELKISELKTYNTDRFIWISDVSTFSFLLKPLSFSLPPVSDSFNLARKFPGFSYWLFCCQLDWLSFTFVDANLILN